MIELTTGLPGNGKTLFAIDMIIERAAKENRVVYYSGIKDVLVDDPRMKGTTWIEFDPLNWHETVPSGAIVFIDEAQKIFRNRSLGSVPPKHVTELEEHRHKGLDFYLNTQHPSLLDPAVRRLTQTHRHLVRVHGYEISTIHLWRTGVKDNCDKARGDSEKVRWQFNKEIYGLYKSADEHTMRKQIPLRLMMLVAAPVVVLLLAGGTAYYLLGMVPEKEQKNREAIAANPVFQIAEENRVANKLADGAPLVGEADIREWLRMNTPRVSDLPETAPKYDSLTAPVRVPVPAMCMQIGSVRDGKQIRCKCYSQQATPMDVEFNTCISLARNGRFMDFDPDPDLKKDRSGERMADAAQARRSAEVLGSRPDVAMRQNYGAPQVIAFDEVQAQFEGQRPPANLNDGPSVAEVRRAMVPQGK